MLEGENELNRNLMFPIFFLLGLLLLVVDHTGHSLGDRLFLSLGIQPWTGEHQSGAHLSAIIGIALLMMGMMCTVTYYKKKLPSIFAWCLLVCIAVYGAFPYAAEKTMFILKQNADGVNSMDYSVKDNSCHFQQEEVEEGDGKRNHVFCNVKLFNYGNAEHVNIRPLFPYYYEVSDFAPATVSVPPHSTVTVEFELWELEGNDMHFSGWIENMEFELTPATAPGNLFG